VGISILGGIVTPKVALRRQNEKENSELASSASQTLMGRSGAIDFEAKTKRRPSTFG